MDNKKLSVGALILFGTASFAMHFGGSCMLWPVTWGQQSGSSVYPAMLGIFITAIILPYLGYVALVRGEGTFYELSNRINRKFTLVFGGLTMALMGPLFVIPRMSAAAWDAFCQVFGLAAPKTVFIILFQVIYYAIAYWFLFQPGKVMDKIGKYLTPILLLTVAAVVVKSLMSPISPHVPKFYQQSGFMYGFLNGYQTMDLPGSLMFAGIIIAGLQSKGFEGKELLKKLLMVAGIGVGLLCCTHMLQMLVGASTGEVFKDVTYAKLYATIILELWGKVGGTIFNIALLFAALTSAIGLGGGAAAYYAESSEGKWSYKTCSLVIMVISAAVASFGLDNIVVWTAPILSLIYPPCIALVLGYIIFARKNMGVISGATIVAFAWGVLDCLIGYAGLFNLDITSIMNVYNMIPFASVGVGWFIPTLLGGVAGAFIIKKGGEGIAA